MPHTFFFFFGADMQHQHCKNIITLLSAWQSGGEKNRAARWAEICHDVRRSGQMIAVTPESHSHETGRSIKVQGEPYKNAVVLTSVTNICRYTWVDSMTTNDFLLLVFILGLPICAFPWLQTSELQHVAPETIPGTKNQLWWAVSVNCLIKYPPSNGVCRTLVFPL